MDKLKASFAKGDDAAATSPAAAPRRWIPRRPRPERSRELVAEQFRTSSRESERGDDVGHQLAGFGRVETDLHTGGEAAHPSCPGPCPSHPETMAPAWPIFLPAGAVTPAM